MTTTEAKWTARVQEWRASGKSAEAFADGQGFKPSTLRVWSSKLKTPAASTRPSVKLTRVVRTQPAPPVVEERGVEIVIGKAHIVVRPGFDASLLREVLAALGGGK
jgi:hypothetical protein